MLGVEMVQLEVQNVYVEIQCESAKFQRVSMDVDVDRLCMTDVMEQRQ